MLILQQANQQKGDAQAMQKLVSGSEAGADHFSEWACEGEGPEIRLLLLLLLLLLASLLPL
jgi:hypothetical protein